MTSEMSQAAAIMMPARRGVLRARYVNGRVTEKYLNNNKINFYRIVLVFFCLFVCLFIVSKEAERWGVGEQTSLTNNLLDTISRKG